MPKKKPKKPLPKYYVVRETLLFHHEDAGGYYELPAGTKVKPIWNPTRQLKGKISEYDYKSLAETYTRLKEKFGSVVLVKNLHGHSVIETRCLISDIELDEIARKRQAAKDAREDDP